MAAKDKKVPLSAKSSRTIRRNTFEVGWTEFIHRVKVHELIRVMLEEDKQLKALREQADLTDLLLGLPEPGMLRKEQEANVLYMKSLEQERQEALELSQNTFRTGSGSEYLPNNTAHLFKTKVEITEEQFDLILALCKTRAEQNQLRAAFREKNNRDKYLHNAGEERRLMYEFLNSQFFNRMMLTLIAASTLIIILLTFESVAVRYSYPLVILDSVIISVFIIEACCKLSMYKQDYFHNVWNLLDLIIILTYFIDVFLELVTKILAMSTEINRSLVFKFFKSLRSLRLLRAIKFLPNLQVVVSTIFQSIISLGSIALLMVIYIFVFAVIGRGVFSEEDPVHYGNIWKAILTLFQLLTLDDWFDILAATDQRSNAKTYWASFAFLFLYIILESFVFLNLFVAVLVDNFQIALKDANLGQKIKELNFKNARELGLDLREEDEEEDYVDESIGKTEPELDLGVSEYFPIDANTQEGRLLQDNLKTLNSLDFESFVWLRRMKLLAIVMEQATIGKAMWGVSLGEKKREEEEGSADEEKE